MQALRHLTLIHVLLPLPLSLIPTYPLTDSCKPFVFGVLPPLMLPIEHWEKTVSDGLSQTFAINSSSYFWKAKCFAPKLQSRDTR